MHNLHKVKQAPMHLYHDLLVLKLQHDTRPPYLLTSTSEQRERKKTSVHVYPQYNIS